MNCDPAGSSNGRAGAIAVQRKGRTPMASVYRQQAARAKGKRLKPPTVKTRRSLMSDTCIVIEVTAPDGTGLLIECETNRDGSGLRVRPYRADERVRVAIGGNAGHEDGCDLIESSADDAACTCGAEWKPASPDATTWRQTSVRAWGVYCHDDSALGGRGFGRWMHDPNKPTPIDMTVRAEYTDREVARTMRDSWAHTGARFSVRPIP